jgi:type II secretory pathway component PulM
MFQKISQSKLISQLKESDISQKISQLKVFDQFNKINQRERLILSAAGVLLLLLMIIQWGFSPILDHHAQLGQQLIDAKQDLEEMALLQAEYKQLTVQADQTKAQIGMRDKNFSLLSFLNDTAAQTGLKNKIVNMKPSTSNRNSSSLPTESVEMKLTDVNLEQLLAFLYRVETSPNLVSIRQISITKEDRKEGMVESILEVETFKP